MRNSELLLGKELEEALKEYGRKVREQWRREGSKVAPVWKRFNKTDHAEKGDRLMREIKFRAWSPSKNLWREDWVMDSYEKTIDLNKERYDDDLILCQYTGLKDKNGKEIWEGDVLAWAGDWCRQDKEERHAVKFGFHSTSSDYYASVAYGFYMEREDLKVDTTHSGEYFDKCEVIGNIYENPELLEDKNEKT